MIVRDSLTAELSGSTEPLLILHGDAPGIDTIVAGCAAEFGDIPIPFPALWDKYGKPAGPRRNEAMLAVGRILREYGHEGKVFAYHNFLPKSKGTKHMIGIARAAAFPVTLFNSHGTSEVLP